MLLRFTIQQLLYILLLGFCSHTVNAQVKFTAKISSAVVGKNESFELKLLVENAANVEQISPPSLNNFSVLSGPNQESGMESINGNTKQYVGITYVLQPKATGNFTIAAAQAKADGKTLSSNTVTIKVTNKTVSNNQPNTNSPFGGLLPFDEPRPEPQFSEFVLRKGEKLFDKINKNLFIRTETDKTNCYIGEPVVVTYKLYTRLKSESNIIKNPSFNGFSVIDLLQPGNISSTVEKYNGREYNVYVLRKAQLYPLQAGETELESAEVENNVHFVKEEYLKKSGFMQLSIPPEAMLNEKIVLRSRPMMIHVKPLPDAGKPASFNGAVGNFTIISEAEKNEFTTDDAGKLRIIIKGEGNITLITAPEFAWPAGIEAYDPATKEDINKFTVPVSGSKMVEYSFTVAKEGAYVLPPVEFSFFDAAAGKYKVLNTKTIPVTVTKGSGKRDALPAAINSKPGKEIFFDTIFTNRWIIILPIAVLIILGLLIWLRKDKRKHAATVAKRDESSEKKSIDIKEEMVVTIEPLLDSREKMEQQDINGFYKTINAELKLFLAAKLKIPAATIDKKSIADALDKSGVPLSTSLEIQRLSDEIEWQLYTPFADGSKMQDVYERAAMLIHSMNRINA